MLVARIPILLLLFLSCSAFQAQLLPPIQNFTPGIYGAENQNWGITQADNGFVYFANNSGLLEFNGSDWQLYPTPNGSIMRSVEAVGTRIYTGFYMEFGYWEADQAGTLQYQSLVDYSPEPLIEDEQFWKIVAIENYLLFQSLERIYIMDTRDNAIEIIDSGSKRAQLFLFGDSVFFHRSGKGLFKLDKGQAVPVTDSPEIGESGIAGVVSFNDTPVLITTRGLFYEFEGNDIKEWRSANGSQLKGIEIYSSAQLRDGSVILGTISSGIYHLDPEGNVMAHIDKEKGLNNNTVLSVYEDRDQNLWLGLDNGISILNLHSPFSEFSDKIGRLGVVYAAQVFKEHLYLGTNQGLFRKPVDSEMPFELVEGTTGQVWCLRVFDEQLFCGHNSGSFIVEGNKARLISDLPGTWDIKKIPGHPGKLLQGNYNGLSILEKQGTEWVLRNKLKGFEISSRFFEFLNSSKILVNHEYKGLYKLNIDDELTLLEEIEREPPRGVGASLVRFNNQVLYASNNGVFRYNAVSDALEPDTLLTDLLYADDERPIGILISDPQNNRLWSFSGNTISYIGPGKFDNRPQLSRIPVPADFRRALGVLGFECISPIGTDRYLIGSSNGYVTLDLEKIKPVSYEVFITTIENEFYDNSLKKQPLKSGLAFPFTDNNLRIEFTVPEYEKYTEVQYQYRLLGLYDEWSNWSADSEVTFNNLPYGNYTFEVNARVGAGITEEAAVFEFRVKRPYYLSNFAIAVYIFLLILLGFLVHKVYRAYYKKQQARILEENAKREKSKKIKAKRKIVQLKNEQLKQEIESKNRELAASTMNLIKKNELLGQLKSQLETVGKDPRIKSVIRTIDRNINNEDDWKIFEEAFNNADKDFLKRIKDLHPQLTSNDLRLCAYLRLNLSSKEIAPLLNISVRSVEVKRYRLRKKIDLPRENSLTDYILSV
ncbi:triple tyrosine motif-containing protein [Zeaxanthinibacter enoshimensis]|uniref:helix-turn-helix and ligand-binding sensor domain-containing protein n=1 Tax=Zeaxanthinibacter enoshimensis TaxID=392009 RepID=UPI00356796B8